MKYMYLINWKLLRLFVDFFDFFQEEDGDCIENGRQESGGDQILDGVFFRIVFEGGDQTVYNNFYYIYQDNYYL